MINLQTISALHGDGGQKSAGACHYDEETASFVGDPAESEPGLRYHAHEIHLQRRVLSKYKECASKSIRHVKEYKKYIYDASDELGVFADDGVEVLRKNEDLYTKFSNGVSHIESKEIIPLRTLLGNPLMMIPLSKTKKRTLAELCTSVLGEEMGKVKFEVMRESSLWGIHKYARVHYWEPLMIPRDVAMDECPKLRHIQTLLRASGKTLIICSPDKGCGEIFHNFLTPEPTLLEKGENFELHLEEFVESDKMAALVLEVYALEDAPDKLLAHIDSFIWASPEVNKTIVVRTLRRWALAHQPSHSLNSFFLFYANTYEESIYYSYFC